MRRCNGTSRSQPLALCLLLAAVVFVSSVAPAQDPCCPAPVPATEHLWTQDGLGPPLWIGADEAGGVFALFRGPDELLSSRSLDGGESWADPVVAVPEIPAGEGFEAEILETGTLLIVYGRLGELRLARSDDRGASFAPPVPLATAGPDAGIVSPTLLRLAGGGAVLAWTESQSFPAKTVGVFAVASEDDGLTWSASRRIDDGGTLEGLVPVRLVASGAAVVAAWGSLGARPAQVLTDRSLDGGLSWGTDRLAASEIEALHGLEIVSAGEGRIALAWRHSDALTFGVDATTSPDTAATWPHPPTRIATGAIKDLRLLAEPTGRVHALLHMEAPSPPLYTVSAGAGLPGTWLAEPLPFATGGVDAHHLRGVESPRGVIVVVHDDYRHDTADCPDRAERGICESIMVDQSCDLGTSWLEEEARLDTDGRPRRNHSEDPEIALAPGGGRLHVLWQDGLQGPVEIHYRAVDLPAAPRPRLVKTIVPGPVCHQFERIELQVESADLAGCNPTAYRWSRDRVEVPGADGPTLVVPADQPPGRTTYRAEIDCGGPEACTLVSLPAVVEIPVPPRIEATEIPPGECTGRRWELTALVDPSLCLDPGYQWHRDGAPIPGAREPVWTTPSDEEPGTHDYHYEITCTRPRACTDASPVESLEVTAPTSPLEGRSLGPGLRVERTGEAVRLRWEDPAPEATAYNLYRGELSAWYSHAPLACHVPREPPGAPTSLREIDAPPGESSYYLVAPADCVAEGRLGEASSGTPRPLEPAEPACGPDP